MTMPTDDASLIERVQAATELLESIAADRGVLVPVDTELRQRLLIAAGQISRPDKYARRQFNRAAQKRDKIVKRKADEAALEDDYACIAYQQIVCVGGSNAISTPLSTAQNIATAK